MKKLVLFIALAILFTYGCKKSSSTDETSVGNCKLMSTVTTTNGVSVSTFYQYDNSGKLLYVKQLNGTTDTALVRKYTYNGNDFSYSTWKDNAGNTDTIFYAYDASKKIIQTIKKNRITGTTLVVETNFKYNSQNQVTQTVSKSTIDSINYTTDSSVFQFEGQNVSGYSEYTQVGSGTWSLYRLNLGYDNQKNFHKITGEPQLSYPYWSENNITGYSNPDSTHAYKVYSYSDFTSSQYPQSFTVTFNPAQPNTHLSGTLTYKCQ
jgi:hypothetical protein